MTQAHNTPTTVTKGNAPKGAAEQPNARHQTFPPASVPGVSTGTQAGLAIERRYTTAGKSPYSGIVWEKRTSVITNPDGSVVFKMDGAEVPSDWSQLATDIIVSKYFRKAGLYGDPTKGETSAKQVVSRVARTIRQAGERFSGYFATPDDAQRFEDELTYL